MALGAERQVADLTEVHERQQRIGYPSDLIVGRGRRARLHARNVPGLAGAGRARRLHEHKGGFANNMASMHGLAGEGDGGRRRLVDGVR